ncbi:MAG: HAMP domain-containing protein, partial [Pseudonocardiales bacterium]
MSQTPSAAKSPVARDRLHGTHRRVDEQVRAAVRTATYSWRHSLQLRVGTTTVLIAGVVVLVIGILLVDQVASGILRAKKDAAIGQAQIGEPSARAVLATVDASAIGDVVDAQRQITANLTASGGSAGLFSIVIESTSVSNVGAPASQIPASLRRTVQDRKLAVQYAPVRETPGSSTLVRGLIVGQPVRARTGQFELYYLFPLTAEQQTIALIQRTVLISGLALVLLVLGIALLVTRLVVRPVRVAAETAGRLAGGDLAQRIKVRGTDDIARLGQSFNDMAGSLQRQI